MSHDRPKPDSNPQYRYILLYKPYNVLCQFTDAEQPQRNLQAVEAAIDPPVRQTLKDYVPIPDIYPVGRLDQDSEGLLLLTNDGKFQHQLINPKFHHPRTYWVQVERVPDELALEQLRRGVVIQDYRTRPAQVRLLDLEPALPPRNPPIRFRKQVPTAWLEITLTEGRNRQVRRMTASVGFPTLRLVRVGIANLRLNDLQPGQWRDLSAAELATLKQQIGKTKLSKC